MLCYFYHTYQSTYQSVKNLSCGVLSIGNPTFQFATIPHAFCQLEFTADLTSLCLIKGLDACPAYSLQHVVKHLHLQSSQSCVEKYESYKSQLFC